MEKNNKIIKKIAQVMTWSKEIRPALHTLFFKWCKLYATDSFKAIKVQFKKCDYGDVNYDATDVKKNNFLEISDLQKKIPDHMPDIDNFFLKNNIIEFGMDVDFLLNTLKIYKLADVKKIKIQLDTPSSPVQIDIKKDHYYKNPEIEEMTSIIMPIRL